MTDTTIIAVLSAVVSVLSLGISATTMYFAWLRRGRLAMTKPALVFFGYDTVPKPIPKIFLRTLLYSTSARGKMIESMYAKLNRGSSEQVFSFWGCGETNDISPGSGLYVGQSGVTMNHHFVLSVHHADYEFAPGRYTIHVFAKLAGADTPIELAQFDVALNEELAGALASRNGVLFELDPDTQSYRGHVSRSKSALAVQSTQ
ncbi:MAG TPA: hypothetical protein VG897_11120 [Terriglobales bacterium]|nr:hypothetical protein [Terriglobales bacterium]